MSKSLQRDFFLLKKTIFEDSNAKREFHFFGTVYKIKNLINPTIFYMALIQQVFIEGPHYVPGMRCQTEEPEFTKVKQKVLFFFPFIK